jgi:hypothetical protein
VRIFKLPTTVDHDTASVDYWNGVLTSSFLTREVRTFAHCPAPDHATLC